MAVQIGAAPPADFSHPLQMLVDCHERIRNFSRVLVEIAAVSAAPLSPSHFTALQNAVEYFSSAAPRHTADEDAGLFPLLLGVSEESSDILRSLIHQHTEIEAHTLRLLATARLILGGAHLDAEGQALFEGEARHWQAEYQSHMALEESSVFPLAAKTLTAEQLAELGRQMAARRERKPLTVTKPAPNLLDIRGCAGAELKKHTAKHPILIRVEEGHVRVTALGKAEELQAGQSLSLAAEEPHSLDFLTDGHVLVTLQF